MSKVYVVVAHGDNGAKYIEDLVEFTINIAVFTSKDMADAFLKYPPALEEACIKHDVIDVDDREGHENFAEWTTDDNGQVFLTTGGYGDDYYYDGDDNLICACDECFNNDYMFDEEE